MTWVRRAVLILLSVALLSLVVVISGVDSLQYPDPPPPAMLPNPPCRTAAPTFLGGRPITDAELELLARRRWPALQGRLRGEPLPQTDRAIEDQMDAAFEPTYASIPEFLDWHYSVAGQYTQLAQTILGQPLASQLAQAALDGLQSSQLAQAILDRLGESELAQAALGRLQDSEPVREAIEQLRRGVDSRLFADLPDRVQHASAGVEGVMKEEMRALIERRIHDEVQTLPARNYAELGTPCTEFGTAELRLAYERMLTAAIPHTIRRFTDSAAPTGIVAAAAAFRGAAAAGALVRGLSGRLLARTATRTAGSIGAALGGLAAGAAAWLLVDFAVLFVDEHLNRDDLERELTTLVDEQKAEIQAAMSRAVDDARSEALGEVPPSELGDRN